MMSPKNEDAYAMGKSTMALNTHEPMRQGEPLIPNQPPQTTIDSVLYQKLVDLGSIDVSGVRDTNVGESNYAEHIIQPWVIWQDWKLNPFDGDIIKRTLRTKTGNERKMDYKKIIHICQERIRQIDAGLE